MDRRGFYRHLYAALERASIQPLLEPAAQPGGERGAPDLAAAQAAASRLPQQGGAHRAGEQLCCLVARLLEAMVLDSRVLDAARQVRRAMRGRPVRVRRVAL